MHRISVNSRFRPYRKFPHLSITNSVTRQGGSINLIQVTVYSFTVPALKLMKVKLYLFLATTAHCHDRAAIKIHITHFLVFLMITKFYKRTKELWDAEIHIISIVFGTYQGAGKRPQPIFSPVSTLC